VVKGGYSLQISQGAGGITPCRFYDSPEFEGPQEDLTGISFKEITTRIGVLRYYEPKETKSTGIISYHFCQLIESKYYQYPLSIGDLNIKIPRTYDQNTFNELTDIIKSITIK
jgi:hypothetical protein